MLGLSLSTIISLVQAGISYGPQIQQLIQAGKPILSAIEEAAPHILPIVRDIAGQVFKAMPSEEAMKAIAEKMFSTKNWSQDELQGWYDKHGSASTY